MHSRVRSVSRIISVFLLTIGWAFGQSTGRIGGSVTDPSGSVIANAAVTCTNNQTGLNRKVETNQQGIFVFPDLPIGTYTVAAEAGGFEAQRRTDVSLLTGQNLDLKFSL